MEEQLISKKELLQLTNISYGQLYRWKRKNLIPEDWFIKKSVSTGQETFFPRHSILERIDAIVNLKDDVSLDELSAIFSPKVEEQLIKVEALYDRKIITEQAMLVYQNIMGTAAVLDDLKHVLVVKVLEDYVVSGKITWVEGKQLIDFLAQHFERLNVEKGMIILVRQMGLPFIFGAVDKDMIIFDESYTKIIELELVKEIGQIKLALM
ncbi:MAG: DUF4004 family protein [Turicibacter sp.]